MFVQKTDGTWELLQGQVLGRTPGTKAIKTKIDSVSTIFNGDFQCREAAGRR